MPTNNDRRIHFLAWLIVATGCVGSVSAQTDVETGIRTSFAQRIPLVMRPFRAVDDTSAEQARALEQLIFADLEFSGIFKIERSDIAAVARPREGLIEVGGGLLRRRGNVYFEGRVTDVASRQNVGAKRYRFNEKQIRQIAHHFADEVIRMLTGESGIASTQVLYRRKGEAGWEIVMADYDGYNPRVLVRQSVPIIYPRWIDRGRALVYTSFRYGNPDLFLRYLKETKSRRLASYDGMNYSVDWSPKRKQMVVTLSKDGNPEIYIMNIDGKIKRRLTHSRAIETSPSWSPSGREVLFTSDRVGNPNIYVMEADGGNVRRLTFDGSYNDSAAWSPRGDIISFVSRIDGLFQICTIKPDGRDLRVLTDEAHNHEDPRWAPDGRHLIYCAKRGGENLITIVDIATKGKRILSQGETPDWLKP